MAGMGNGGRDIAVLLGGFERDGCMNGVIEGVDHVVSGARVIVVLLEQLQCQGPGLHVHAFAHVAGVTGGRQGRHNIESHNLIVIGVFPVELFHCLVPGNAAFGHAAGSQGVGFGCLEKALLLVIGRLGQS